MSLANEKRVFPSYIYGILFYSSLRHYLHFPIVHLSPTAILCCILLMSVGRVFSILIINVTVTIYSINITIFSLVLSLVLFATVKQQRISLIIFTFPSSLKWWPLYYE
ncbi:hypothetical protein BDF14DRAFT_1751118 [Spinellus fusiger]|nr:hypothetical protein BDF14DRAFT_1872134 [Spinellus fusiger]KAI7873019.1 hypothetical protein BDF14DRAFT_1751118 [Spinellus fusiger]